MQSLHDIQGFGWMDALDDGKYLDECFEVHATFRRILKDPPLLVLGRKGTGKTAICERILRISSPSLFTKKLNFAGYDWDRQDRETGGLDPQQCWKYAILLSLAGMVIRDASTASSGETHERLEEFLVETYGSLDIAFHQAFRPQRRLRLKALEFSAEAIRGLKTGAKFESEELPSSRLPSVIDDLNTTLETVILNTMNPEHFYYVLFDELDRDFHRGDQKYQRRLEGLFKAALDLLRASRDARLGVRIMVFLRSDIYEDEVTLSGEKNKITQNFTHTLDWSTPYLQRELKSLMEKRFRAALKDDRATWASVFGESSIGFPRRESFHIRPGTHHVPSPGFHSIRELRPESVSGARGRCGGVLGTGRPRSLLPVRRVSLRRIARRSRRANSRSPNLFRNAQACEHREVLLGGIRVGARKLPTAAQAAAAAEDGPSAPV